MRRPIAGGAILALLAPVIAEYLLGDQYLAGPPGPKHLLMLVLYVPFYGFGAIGVREIARRTGGGWPAILTLGLAFSLIEEGLLNQTLFNAGYLGLHLSDQARVPVLGISALWTTYVLMLHTVWSIAAPIAVIERLIGTGPWLGRIGIGVTAALYLLGAAGTAGTTLLLSNGYVAPAAQLVGTAVLVVALVVVATHSAVRARGTRPAAGPRWAGGSQLLGLALGLVLSSVFQLSRYVGGAGPWGQTAIMLGAVVVAAVLAYRLRPGAFGLGVGAVLTYWWVGMSVAVGGGAAAIVEQSLLIAASAVLMVVAARWPAPGGGPAGRGGAGGRDRPARPATTTG